MDDEELFREAIRTYEIGEPILTDQEYDILKKKLEAKDSKFKDSSNVGAKPINGKPKVTHKYPMYSMSDVFTVDEAVDWMVKVLSQYPNAGFNIEFKYDGMAIVIYYKDGHILCAAKRGNGLIGEDVTKHIRLVDTIPDNIGINGEVELKGELVIPIKNFELNNMDNRYSNTRSMVAGTLNSDDVSLMVTRGVEFYPWGIVGLHHNTEMDKYAFIKDMGLRTLPIKRDIVKGDIDLYYKHAISIRDTLPIAIDGIVITVNDYYIQEELGVSGKYPNWMIALKLPAIEMVTVLLDHINQVGRTGVITPVGIIKPVDIDGTTVQRSTLNNYDIISTMDIRMGDQVVVIKSGDIIPKVIKVFKDRRTGNEVPIEKPTNCPSCNSTLITKGSKLMCYNIKCKGRVLENMVFFAGRDQMNIEGFGPGLISKLIDKEYIIDQASFFNLTKNMLTDVGVSTTYADKLLSNIERVSHVSFNKLISSLGIPKVGKRITKSLNDVYGNDFIYRDVDSLTKVFGVGDEIAGSLVSYVKDNGTMISELLSSVKLIKPATGKLTGKVFVITGSFDDVKRTDISKEIIDNGGSISSSVTNNTSYLVAGVGGGSKLDTAKNKKINIITLDELRSLY